MQSLAHEGRFRRDNTNILNDTYFAGAIGKITNEEQFIPLYTAVPLLGRSNSHDLIVGESCLNYLTNTRIVLTKNGTVIEARLRCIFRDVLFSFSGVNSEARYYTILEAGGNIAYTNSLAHGNYTIEHIKRVIKDFPYSKELLRKVIKFRLKREIQQLINTVPLFGLVSREIDNLLAGNNGANSLAVRMSATDTFHLPYIHETGWYNYLHAYNSPTAVNRFLIRYHYFAQIGASPPISSLIFPSGLISRVTRAGNSFGKPLRSPAYGVCTLATTVIKAKHREYICAMAACGMENKIALPSSDIELWVSPRISEPGVLGAITREEPIDLVKRLFCIAENNKLIVKEVEDIDEKVYGELPPQSVKERAKTALEAARAIADMYLKDPLHVFDTINSL